MSEAQSIQWFPGHMARAKKQIEKSLKQVDAVAEIADARIPVSSRNPILEHIIQGKPRIILLNKRDMADPTATKQWVSFYQQKNIEAVDIDCKSGKGLGAFQPAVRKVLAPQIASWKQKGMTGRTIRVMVIGIPNVGKSSFINRLSHGSHAAVENRPGVTRSNQWFSIGKGFDLLDTPGVLWPKIEDKMVGEHLAFTGAVKDDILDLEDLASRLLELLCRLYPNAVRSRYKLGETDFSGMEGWQILQLVGKKRGMLVSGGEIDTERTSKMLLDEFRAGKIGRITLEQAGGVQ
ncbi:MULTISPECIES: ribosome biogenesis GTPase YlqF [Caproicibacterium]|jgi:ribosome biogenesis GTPase A|uniref:Ribosome biogenesis GTPase A n=1 Tax=Caproicibacterium lactatifermentans TaxID=2666138 RepID=A0A859DR55_9FIRM|nr:ribosome biogenesis GTPase YlqF [Caproicibacterium lactatifermentans]ARP50300.1 ribosome biogenesis GTPase YlqF [Ruminococcaceae bacterium CPB6]MDD4807317.1 ribosome biogenesis GTPase YlqF [Oscillospiraceae bacterium]QKN23979.1 ribosome biogenesis GTPase YlqF [Caproicibacterium lactatifermentans]QKO30950.1 ribosome biogenesis GTPase YlqF [Caproicibacterium lactatifermentans]